MTICILAWGYGQQNMTICILARGYGQQNMTICILARGHGQQSMTICILAWVCRHSIPNSIPQKGAMGHHYIYLIKTEYWDRAGGGGNISYD